MFRQKNSNTKISNVEKTYGLDLNARGDMKLGTMLRRWGFDSQSQLVRAAGCPTFLAFRKVGFNGAVPVGIFADFELACGIGMWTEPALSGVERNVCAHEQIRGSLRTAAEGHPISSLWANV